MNLQALDTDKRHFNRIAFDSPVVLRQEDNEWKSKLVDISLKGALILEPDNWKQNDNDDYQLSIQLDNSDIEINMDVKLAHAENEQIGFHCEHIDIDSVTDLRRLVELNLGDEELLNRDIANMLEQ
jgi:PilZ domain